MTNLKRLENALKFLPVGQYVTLDGDTFLTGLLDGSDKVYGFGRDEAGYCVMGSGDPYPLSDLTKEDLSYIFKYSIPNIYEGIRNAKYFIEFIENY